MKPSEYDYRSKLDNPKGGKWTMETIVGKKINRLVVLLIKPTTHDDCGYPLRFRKGVLPSNSLAALNGLTKRILTSGNLPINRFAIRVYDDAVWPQRIDDPAGLVQPWLDGRTQVVVGLVGVQTNQFPRAAYLAQAFKQAGAAVVIGGFHVSGSISTILDGISAADPKRAKEKDIPCPGIMPPEIKDLLTQGIIVCHGEAEEVYPTILSDILAGKNPRQYYWPDILERIKRQENIPGLFYRGGRPSIVDAPMPEYPPGYFRHFATNLATIDTGRGCPFACSFCTIINVQGRNPRYRNPAKIIELVEITCEREGRFRGFFTDDNFARVPHWKEILDGMISLRQQGLDIGFMIQADLASHKLPGFIDKLAQAGCTQIFLGMESVNPANLAAAGKRQNKVADYVVFCDKLHAHGIGVHGSYIIGFANDTADSIMADIETLKQIGVDQVSVYILTPLPGSEDHVRMFVAGVPMDADFDRYDSFHAVTDHPNIPRDELEKLLLKFFAEFYRSKQMIAALKRMPERLFWPLMRNYFWYRNSALGEKVHPMMCGFWSMWSRRERRPGLPPESLWRFLAHKAWRRLKYVGHMFREFYIFQHVYFEARLRDDISEQVNYRVGQAKGWWSNVWRKPNRRWLNEFWKKYGRQKWQLLWKPHWHLRMLPYAATEVVYTFYFFGVLAKQLPAMTR